MNNLDAQRVQIERSGAKLIAECKSASTIKGVSKLIAEFKSASTLKGVKLGCDKTRKNFARSELDKI